MEINRDKRNNGEIRLLHQYWIQQSQDEKTEE